MQPESEQNSTWISKTLRWEENTHINFHQNTNTKFSFLILVTSWKFQYQRKWLTNNKHLKKFRANTHFSNSKQTLNAKNFTTATHSYFKEFCEKQSILIFSFLYSHILRKIQTQQTSLVNNKNRLYWAYSIAFTDRFFNSNLFSSVFLIWSNDLFHFTFPFQFATKWNHLVG